MTSTRHAADHDGYFWALEELIGLAGNRSPTTLAKVHVSNTFERFPNWSAFRSQDGLSALGLPERIEPSPTMGYMSAPAIDRYARKWLMVDLGAEYPIDEVRIIPVESEKLETIGKESFPRGWLTELSTDPDFNHVTWQYLSPSTNVVGHPGANLRILPANKAKGRYLRLVTLDLWGEESISSYGLAEIQAYSGNQNVALGKPVIASDAADAGPEWSPAFLTNGFSSRRRLIEIPEHLDLIARRGTLEQERDDLLAARTRTINATGLVLGYGGGMLGIFSLLGGGWAMVRQKIVRRQALGRLREQIARDLHDDIGTNLSGIVLLSEIGSHHSKDPDSRQDFQQILEAAENTSRSMQDIVWLIEHGNIGLRTVIARMRESAAFILGTDGFALAVDPPDFRDRQLSLFFRRHFFFAYKEALHNVRRHAAASHVDIRIEVDGRTLRFDVRDDGTGFDPDVQSPGGHGLANLRRRAERLNGRCHVHSKPGAGTRVRFEAPIQLQK